jgi:hypothetical protein
MGKDLKGKELGKGISQRADGRYIARFTSKTGKRKTLYDFKLNELKRKLREAVYEDEHGLNGNRRKYHFKCVVCNVDGVV